MATTIKRSPVKVSRVQPQSSARMEPTVQAKPLVFISHDSRDAELAEAFSKLLSGISAGILKSFRSSDKKGNQGIEFGVEWYPEVMTQIDSATDVVCLLTPASLERPWILYEAGVAKGKMNIPVFGVALGIALAKASTGPFAQFQNCGEDSDSLTKLVTQLMSRIPGAEPDKDTVKMQVDTFRTRASELLKSSTVSRPREKSQSDADESVAKLFEEVKVMFRDLPSRLEKRIEPTSRRKRRFHPEMFFHLSHRLGGSRNDELGFLIMISMVKDDLPWLYEMGMDVYRNLNVIQGGTRFLESAKRLRRACDLVAHEPVFRDMFRDDETMFAAIELGSSRSLGEAWLPVRKRKEEKLRDTQNLTALGYAPDTSHPRYTPSMSLALDPATEQRIAERIQREIDRGHYQTPAEVIDHALSLLESEESWSPEEKADLERHLAGSLAEAQRGEVHTPEEVRTLLQQDRQQRANQLQ